MNNYKGISADEKHKIVAALKARGAGSWRSRLALQPLGVWPHLAADLRRTAPTSTTVATA